MRALSTFLIVVAVAACASAPSRPANIPEPGIDTRIVSPVMFGRSAEAPVTVDVVVENRANVPIIVRRVEIDTPGQSQIGLARVSQIVNQTIAAGATEAVPIYTRAIRTTANPGEPLSIRAIVEFEAEGKRWREIFRTMG